MSGRAERFRVLIAGAGVAGLEAALALSRLAPGLVDVELIDPGPEFVYRPLLVAEPFGVDATIRFELESLVPQTGARLRRDALSAVDPVARVLTTAGAVELAYDALLLAPGARPTACVPGAIGFGTAPGRLALDRMLADLGRPGAQRVAFVVPGAATWTLAAYELALLTAAERSARSLPDVEIVVVTSELAPLQAFGAEASRIVAARLDEAGIGLHVAVDVQELRDGRLVGDDTAIPCERAVALPRLVVDEIAGLPQGSHGFLPTDVQMQVAGLPSVWAAGDVTSFPVKQGGLASQQADVAARAIAVRAGAHIPIRAFRPILRAELITGGAPEFLRSHRGADGESAHSREPLWWPPEKIAARYLAPLLAAESEGIEFGELIDLDPPDDPVAADAETERAVSLLLAAADADARSGDYAKALASLELVERLDLVLPPEYVARRDRWRHELDKSSGPSKAGGRVDPSLISAKLAISDLERRIGRLRRLEARTGGEMRRDLAHLDEGMRQLKRLSRETGLLPPER